MINRRVAHKDLTWLVYITKPPHRNIGAWHDSNTLQTLPGINIEVQDCQTPNFPKKFKFFKLQLNIINAVTNCLISYMLLNSLSALSFDYVCLYRTVSFQFTDLFSSCDHKVELSWKNWAYLAFELTQKFSCAYKLTGKKFRCCLSLILKHSDISSSHNNNSVENIIAKQFPKLIQVKSFNCLPF